uniref:Uncharacterized protein n=1 Tax=Musa acuminata TaxID=4641 RepID=Q1EPC0_MUSAC|nr:hypothetical protein MA4_78I12.68 [Musa acuminata]
MAPKRSKGIRIEGDLYNHDLFRSKEVALSFPKFETRCVHKGKYVDLVELEDLDPIRWFVHLEALPLLQIEEPIYPRLVRLFYANLYEDNDSLSTYILGTPIRIFDNTICELIGITEKDRGCYFKGKWDVKTIGATYTEAPRRTDPIPSPIEHPETPILMGNESPPPKSFGAAPSAPISSSEDLIMAELSQIKSQQQQIQNQQAEILKTLQQMNEKMDIMINYDNQKTQSKDTGVKFDGRLRVRRIVGDAAGTNREEIGNLSERSEVHRRDRRRFTKITEKARLLVKVITTKPVKLESQAVAPPGWAVGQPPSTRELGGDTSLAGRLHRPAPERWAVAPPAPGTLREFKFWSPKFESS